MNAINMTAELFVRNQEEIIPISDPDAEKMRKEVLSATDVNTVMQKLANGMVSKFSAARCFDEMLDIIHELHLRSFMAPAEANLFLKQGAICESMRDYSLAMDYYAMGIQAYATMIEPDQEEGYWLFNNSAFCYNYERLFQGGQKQTNKAISLNGEQYNAWKNLGVSLEHQYRYVEAAASYMASYIKCGGGRDPRPMMHLERIFKRHDKLKDALANQAEKEIGNIFSGPFKDFCLGETYYQCGHFDRAIDSYEKFYADASSGYASHLEYVQRTVKDLKELRKMEEQFTEKKEAV